MSANDGEKIRAAKADLHYIEISGEQLECSTICSTDQRKSFTYLLAAATEEYAGQKRLIV